MEKLHVKKGSHTKVTPRVLEHCVQTVDGLENVSIDEETGEITYTPAECVDKTLLKETLEKEGIELEE